MSHEAVPDRDPVPLQGDQTAGRVDPGERAARPSRPTPPAFAIGLLLGIVAGALGLIVALVVSLRDPLPIISQADLTAARARWQAKGPADYRAVIEVSGNQTGTYTVEVRGGEPVEVVRNPGDREPPRRTWPYWTVPGLLDVIERELEGCEAAERTPGSPKVLVRAEFDPQLGVPRRFRRSALGATGEIGWKVASFERLE